MRLDDEFWEDFKTINDNWKVRIWSLLISDPGSTIGDNCFPTYNGLVKSGDHYKKSEYRIDDSGLSASPYPIGIGFLLFNLIIIYLINNGVNDYFNNSKIYIRMSCLVIRVGSFSIRTVARALILSLIFVISQFYGPSNAFRWSETRWHL